MNNFVSNDAADDESADGKDNTLSRYNFSEGDIDGVAIFDAQWNCHFANAALERMTGRATSEIVSLSAPELWPDAFYSPYFDALRHAMSSRTAVAARVTSEHPDLWHDIQCSPIELAGVGVGILVRWRDADLPKPATGLHLDNNYYALAAARAIDAVQDGYLTLDGQYVIRFANAGASRINRKPAEAIIGRSIWDEWPGLIGSPLEDAYRAAMERREPQHLAHKSSGPEVSDIWVDVSIYPDEIGGGLHVAYRDVTNRVKREQREQFHLELLDRTGELTDPDEIIDYVVRSVGLQLNVSRCAFADNLDTETCYIRSNYCADSVADMSGPFDTRAFGDYLTDELEAGRVVVVNDVRREPLKAPVESLVHYDNAGIAAHVTVPLFHASRLVSAIGVHSNLPRIWTNEEITLLKIVVDRTWLIVEVAKQHRALENEVTQRREIARRQAQFTALVQNSSDFLGIARLDGKVIFLNAAGRRLIGLPSDEDFDIESMDVNVRDLFFPEDLDFVLNEFLPRVVQEGHGVTEIRFRHAVTGLPVWVDYAKFVVRDPETDEITALMSITRDISERRRQEAEQERLQLRERNIAQQLQSALLPIQPDHLPGLGVRGYYRAALQEAGVGGDFSDGFSCGAGNNTCFVVADVSGKGLRAASQVAAIRNMFRFAIHQSNSIVTAVSQLNRVFVEQEHLEGFATFFAGVFDPEQRSFTYVNCGQEPGLVWRTSSKSVEYLQATGSVLGAYTNDNFTEVTISLNSGDVVALFTDGLTEAGPERMRLLGIDGVSRLFANSVASLGRQTTTVSENTASAIAASIVTSLVADIEQYAGGADALRDDIVLLVLIAY